MGGYGIDEVGAGANEQVGRIVNGTSLTSRPFAGLEAGRGCRFTEAETGVNNELAEVEEFAESDRGWFCEEVLS